MNAQHPSDFQSSVQDEIAKYTRIFQREENYVALRRDVPRSWDFIETKSYQLIRKANQGRSIHDEVIYRLRRSGGGRVLSIGSGAGEQEITIGHRLQKDGIQFQMTCLELDHDLAEAGQRRADAEGLSIQFQVGDPDHLSLAAAEFDVVICFMALSPLRNLEHVLFEINRALKPDGALVIVDIITRNGYRMWESTFDVVRSLWNVLPAKYKFNFTSYEKPQIDLDFRNRDYRVEVGASLRPQDLRRAQMAPRSEEILPLLDEFLHREVYIPYYSIVRRFFDKMYGPCYDTTKWMDRTIIQMIWVLDIYYIKNGMLRPETFFGVYSKGPVRSRPPKHGKVFAELPAGETLARRLPAEKKSLGTVLRAVIPQWIIRARHAINERVQSIWSMLKETRRIHGEPFPPGHFYSAIPSAEDRLDFLKAAPSDEPVLGIAMESDEQLRLLERFLAYYAEAHFPDEKTAGFRYFYNNPFYSYGDALTLYSMMREFKPGKIIEIGSGYSSCLMLDVNEVFFDRRIELAFIEPHPRELYSLLGPDDRDCVILPVKVQSVDTQLFASLQANDMLLVDSTHVSKLRSDVNHVFFEILPVLGEGVLVHFHDIFWPFEYPKDSVSKGLAWNEAYLLRAFLQFNNSYEIVFFADYMHQRYKAWFEKHMPLFLRNPGGNFWLRKRVNAPGGR
jgi:ubiquinone/menaquinone biosynthesis C-methylase UbiE